MHATQVVIGNLLFLNAMSTFLSQSKQTLNNATVISVIHITEAGS